MLLDSIRFYERVEVLLNIKFRGCNNEETHVETRHLIMITTYTNMTYHEYQGMFDIALFLTKISNRAQ